VNDFADGFLRSACIDAQNPGIGIRSKLAENGVGKALLLTNFLEEPRRHAAAEKIVEDRGGKAAVIGEGNGGHADADVGLFEVALGFKMNGRRSGGSGIVGVEVRSGQIAELFFDEVENFAVRDVAGGGDEKMIGCEPVAETAAQGFAFKFADGFRGTENW